MSRIVALDSSALVCWITQSRGWQQIQALIDRADVTLTLPGPVLTESIYVSREKGNASTGAQITATLEALGMTVEPPVTVDVVRAAEMVEVSRSSPGPVHRATGKEATLSLGDALILAVTERLGCPVVTRDRYWVTFAEQGHTTAAVHLW